MSILICYDGSADSQAAIKAAGDLFRGRDALILTVWEGFTGVVTRAAAGLATATLDFEEIDRATREAAQATAEEGCGQARDAGLEARPLIVERLGPVWDTILSQATDTNAEVIVLGTRGLTGVRSLLLGSVSNGVLQHADRPVIVIPAAEIAAKRARSRTENTEPAQG